ncbi:MAG: type 1 glutamine amidotransferase [Rhodopila sp.]
MPRILIADGAPSAWQANLAAHGVPDNTAMFEHALRLHDPDAVCIPVNIADGELLPPGTGLSDFDAVVLPGSPLHACDSIPAVIRQIEFLRAVFATHLPVWGSCWGLQLATVVLGGSVRVNPRGRALSIARRITLTDDGRHHPVLANRPAAFDALCSHLDEVERLPSGARVLAGNAHCAIQAMAAPTPGGGGLLGVQYHPEHDLTFSATVMRVRPDLGIEAGLAPDANSALAMADDFVALHGGNRPDLASRYGLDEQVLDPRCRTADLGGWLRMVVCGHPV